MATLLPEQELQQQLSASQQQNQVLEVQMQQAAQAVRTLQAELQQLRAASQLSPQQPSLVAGSASSPAMGRIDLKPMAPSAFHGTASNNADQWLMEMERYFAVAAMPEADPRRVPFASTFLKEIASTWYTSVHAEIAGWNNFKQRFLQRFRPLAASRMARAAIRNLRQRFKVASYSAEFQKHLQHITDMSAADQIEFYISGLQSHLAMEVDRDAPKTLGEAMESAQRIELMLASRRGPGASFGRSRHYFSSYNPGASGGQGTRSEDMMDLSALQDMLEQETAQEQEQGETNPSAAAVLARLAAMFPRGGGRGGPARGGRSLTNSRRVPNLSQEEYDRLSREGKCFRCKQENHLARNCPSARTSGDRQASFESQSKK